MAIDKVSITGIEAFGFHGVFEHEKKKDKNLLLMLNLNTIPLKLFKQIS